MSLCKLCEKRNVNGRILTLEKRLKALETLIMKKPKYTYSVQKTLDTHKWIVREYDNSENDFQDTIEEIIRLARIEKQNILADHINTFLEYYKTEEKNIDYTFNCIKYLLLNKQYKIHGPLNRLKTYWAGVVRRRLHIY